jgi:putative peptidoglycan lipid II flippase
MFGLPSAVGLFLLAEPMIVTLFEYGKFTAADSTMSSYSLMAYSLGLPAFILIKILAPAFFSRQDTRTPVRIGIIALVSNMAYTLILVLPMVWFDFVAPHTGLALATTLSAWQQAIMLYLRLRNQGIYSVGNHVVRFAGKSIAAAAVMAGVLFLFSQVDWHNLDASARAIRLLGTIFAGTLSYASILLVLGVRPTALAGP